MARALSVKVPTALVISQVEAKIAEIKTAIANYPAAKRQYEIDKAVHRKTILEAVKTSLVENASMIGENYDSPIRLHIGYTGNVVAEFDSKALGFPDEPVAPQEPNGYIYPRGGGRTTPLETLEKTLKVLKMTEQTEVNASTYSSVMDLL